MVHVSLSYLTDLSNVYFITELLVVGNILVDEPMEILTYLRYLIYLPDLPIHQNFEWQNFKCKKTETLLPFKCCCAKTPNYHIQFETHYVNRSQDRIKITALFINTLPSVRLTESVNFKLILFLQCLVSFCLISENKTGVHRHRPRTSEKLPIWLY